MTSKTTNKFSPEVRARAVRMVLADLSFRCSNPISRIGIHIAIFSEPFLSLVLSGEKKIES